jgi:hypothetical protein
MGLGMSHAIKRVVGHSEDGTPVLRRREMTKCKRATGCRNNRSSQYFGFLDTTKLWSKSFDAHENIPVAAT